MTFHTSEPLTWLAENNGKKVVDFLSEGVRLFERQLARGHRRVRHQRARLEALALETDRLREDAEQWAEVLDREIRCASNRAALRKLIEKSRGLAALKRLADGLERDLATLEEKVREDSATLCRLQQKLLWQQCATNLSGPIAHPFSAPRLQGAPRR